MNIKDFEENVEEKILERGYNYYINNRILSYKKEGDKYSFEIGGSDLYDIYVTLDEELEIIDSMCNCPYDYGFTCKHEVASYYKIQELELGVVRREKREVVTEEIKYHTPTIHEEYVKYRKGIQAIFEQKTKDELVGTLMKILENNVHLAKGYIKTLKEKEAKEMSEEELYKYSKERIKYFSENYRESEEPEEYNFPYSYNYYEYEEWHDDYMDVDTEQLKKEVTEFLDLLGDNLDLLSRIKIIVDLLQVLRELGSSSEYNSYDDTWRIVVDYLEENLLLTDELDKKERLEIFNELVKLEPKVVGKYEVALDIKLLLRFCDIEEAKKKILSYLVFSNEKYYNDEEKMTKQ